MAERFVRACRWAGRIAHVTPRGDEAAAGPGPRRFLSRLGGHAARRAVADSRLRSALDFSGLAVGPGEVKALAGIVATVTAVGGLALLTLVITAFGAPLLVALPAALGAPLLSAAAVLGYPESLARRMRLAALGSTLEAVNYVAMSLRVRPSLERAVAFAADHMDGPLAVRLRRVLWEVYLRTRTEIEAAFLALADEWGAWDRELKRASYILVNAVREGFRDELIRALDRALALLYEGARHRFRDYAAALRGPTSALFALGVLLPLIVGSMVPLLSIGTFAPTAVRVRDPTPGDPVPWILLLDGVLPLTTFAFAHLVSSKRPGTGRSAIRVRVSRHHWMALVPIPLAASAPLAIPHPFVPTLSLGGVIGSAALFLFVVTRQPRRERSRIEELEGGFPDALFQLGSRLREGRGLEDALFAVGNGLQGTATGELFDRIAHALRFGGGTVEGSLFGPRGVLRDVPSNTVRATLKMVVEIAAKDPEAAGRATLEMSGHLRDLQEVERDLRAELRPTVEAMRATATFFAPVVLGVTAALYGLLADAFATLGSLPMEPVAFPVALGVYLVLVTAAIVHFVTRIEVGHDPVAFGATLARAWPIAYGVFAATFVFAALAF